MLELVRSQPMGCQKQFLSKYNINFKNYHSKKRKNQFALFPHQNFYKYETEAFDVVIPCPELVRYYMCATNKLTSLVFSPGMAKVLSEVENGIEPRNKNGSAWFPANFNRLMALASTSGTRDAARLPYKHMLMNRIKNRGHWSANHTQILTRIPFATETFMWVSYDAFPTGVEGHTNKPTLVVDTIHDSLAYDNWVEHMMELSPTTLSAQSDVWDAQGGYWDRRDKDQRYEYIRPNPVAKAYCKSLIDESQHYANTLVY
jgi:hypothetical protein